jgi:hypothetical protein
MAPFSNPPSDSHCVLNPHRQQRDSRHYSGVSSGSKIFSFIPEPFLQVENSYSFRRSVIKKKVLKSTNSKHNAAWGEGLNLSRTNTICKVFVRPSVNFYIPFPEQENDGNPKLTKAYVYVCVCVCVCVCVRVCVCVAFLERWDAWCYIKPIYQRYSSFLPFLLHSLFNHLLHTFVHFFTFSLLLHCAYLLLT